MRRHFSFRYSLLTVRAVFKSLRGLDSKWQPAWILCSGDFSLSCKKAKLVCLRLDELRCHNALPHVYQGSPTGFIAWMLWSGPTCARDVIAPNKRSDASHECLRNMQCKHTTCREVGIKVMLPGSKSWRTSPWALLLTTQAWVDRKMHSLKEDLVSYAPCETGVFLAGSRIGRRTNHAILRILLVQIDILVKNHSLTSLTTRIDWQD